MAAFGLVVAGKFSTSVKKDGGGFFLRREKILASPPAPRFTLGAAWKSEHPTTESPQNVIGLCA